jgi:predicted CXXCH cytochrome family protein
MLLFGQGKASSQLVATLRLRGRGMSQQIRKRLLTLKARTQFFAFAVLLGGITWVTYATAAAIVGDPVLGADDPILGSKHDFTGLNARAGVAAMSGVAFSDYGYSCVYCHIPPEEAGAIPSDFGGIDGWNRYVPALGNYQLYDSANLDNKTSGPNPISMLCLSCHDGTMAVDMVVFKPATFDPAADNAMHMRINPEDNIESCGKCHNGDVAHDITVKMLGTDLRNDHPISMKYAGLTFKDRDFRPPDTADGFSNGVKLYNGQVECMTCHNVHDPSRELLLRANAEVLCFTCHTK